MPSQCPGKQNYLSQNVQERRLDIVSDLIKNARADNEQWSLQDEINQLGLPTGHGLLYSTETQPVKLKV